MLILAHTKTLPKRTPNAPLPKKQVLLGCTTSEEASTLGVRHYSVESTFGVFHLSFRSLGVGGELPVRLWGRTKYEAHWSSGEIFLILKLNQLYGLVTIREWNYI